MGKYSLKCSSSNWAWTYYRIPPSLLAQINVPFTFIKGMCSVVVTVMVDKPLSPILKGNH